MELGFVQVALGEHKQALISFARAERQSPFDQASASLGADFNARVAEGRARAWREMGDLAQATTFLQEALRFTPEDSRRWMALAEVYEARGMDHYANEARQRGATLKQ